MGRSPSHASPHNDPRVTVADRNCGGGVRCVALLHNCPPLSIVLSSGHIPIPFLGPFHFEEESDIQLGPSPPSVSVSPPRTANKVCGT